MSRVVSHAVKQASLNLKDMIDKKSVGLDVADLEGQFPLNEIKRWGQEDVKPEIIETTIAQIKGMFNVGTEVKTWSAVYVPPPVYDSTKRLYTPAQTSIKALSDATAARFVIIIGSRDIANLEVAVGGTEAESSYLVLPGDCLYLKITVAPVLNINFNNINNEKLAARKGFRETMIKKNINNRHILLIDGHIETASIVDKVKDELLATRGISV